MLPMLIAGFLLLACLLLFIRWFAAADPRTLTFAAKAVGAAVLVTNTETSIPSSWRMRAARVQHHSS